MKTIQTKNQTLQQATETISDILAAGAKQGLHFTIVHHDILKRFSLTSVKHTDAFASLYSDVEILFSAGRKYAQLVINYE